MHRIDRMFGALGFTLTLSLKGEGTTDSPLLQGEGIVSFEIGRSGLAVAAGVLAGVAGGVEDGVLVGELLVHGGVAIGVAAKG